MKKKQSPIVPLTIVLVLVVVVVAISFGSMKQPENVTQNLVGDGKNSSAGKVDLKKSIKAETKDAKETTGIQRSTIFDAKPGVILEAPRAPKGPNELAPATGWWDQKLAASSPNAK